MPRGRPKKQVTSDNIGTGQKPSKNIQLPGEEFKPAAPAPKEVVYFLGVGSTVVEVPEKTIMTDEAGNELPYVKVKQVCVRFPEGDGFKYRATNPIVIAGLRAQGYKEWTKEGARASKEAEIKRMEPNDDISGYGN